MHITKVAEEATKIGSVKIILKVNSHNGEAVVETQYNVLIVL